MSKCWYCNEELTTANYCDEHIGICTKCYGSMFQVSNEFVKGLMDKISDLEAKLAESDKTIDEINKEFLSAIKNWKQLVEIEKTEKEQLKQQLAEKDKEIKELLNYDRCSHCSYGQANKEYREKCSELIEELAEVKNSCDYYMNRANDLLLKDQDKISFAVEQLTLFKNTIVNKMNNPYSVNIKHILSDFNNQIKQLKEMK